ncbi:Pantoate-beta-alanine ligase [Ramicandelaber brevisporus]|nr:Pantoate-beta-alanine ligase [Ramicandelaber brevisporus]
MSSTSSAFSSSSSSSSIKPVVINELAAFRRWRREQLLSGKTIGFVPTMGALHDGHLALAKQAREQCDTVVMSIFVNPAQFAPTEDLDKYPRTLDSDLAAIQRTFDASNSSEPVVVFVPKVSEMYPVGIALERSKQRGAFVEIVDQSHQMEGSIRPHFFRGVATVVTKLLNAVQPEKAFFGQKDVQQCVVVRSLVRDLLIPTEIVVGETIREHDGLAMSSRNVYLSPEDRAAAPVLYKALLAGQNVAKSAGASSPVSRQAILDAANAVISKEPRATLEYLSIADPDTLSEVDSMTDHGAIFSGAVKLGKTRIIDNVLLNFKF